MSFNDNNGLTCNIVLKLKNEEPKNNLSNIKAIGWCLGMIADISIHYVQLIKSL